MTEFAQLSIIANFSYSRDIQSMISYNNYDYTEIHEILHKQKCERCNINHSESESIDDSQKKYCSNHRSEEKDIISSSIVIADIKSSADDKRSRKTMFDLTKFSIRLESHLYVIIKDDEFLLVRVFSENNDDLNSIIDV